MKVTDRQYALELDKNDPLARFKSQFVISDPEMCYLDGNSLGRLPKATVTAINDFMTCKKRLWFKVEVHSYNGKLLNTTN